MYGQAMGRKRYIRDDFNVAWNDDSQSTIGPWKIKFKQLKFTFFQRGLEYHSCQLLLKIVRK